MPIERSRKSLVRIGALFLPLALSEMLAHAQAQTVTLTVGNVWVSYAGTNCSSAPDGNGRFYCVGPTNAANMEPVVSGASGGNIANNPHIEFDQFPPDPNCSSSPNIPAGSTNTNVCNSRVFLCANLGYTNQPAGSDIGVDKLEFEIFKFANGSNPNDPGSTPPVRTLAINMQNQTMPSGTNGTLPTAATCGAFAAGCGYCVMWDGSINILGDVGKSNGTYGYRAHVFTNQNGASGPITIDNTKAYPSGATLDSNGAVVMQQPVTLDVTDVHVVRTTPTVVGAITGVAAEPYNITYRLSKDATTYLGIYGAGASGVTLVRRIVPGLPRVGEGTPDGSLQNGDAWDGRADNGDLMPPGVYLAEINAVADDQYGHDVSTMVTRQVGIDPLQITDILVQPLGGQATSLATLTYTLTEPAMVYVDVYPPGTQFCAGLTSVNSASVGVYALDNTETSTSPPKNFWPNSATCSNTSYIPPLRRWVEQKTYRQQVVSFWDGRDSGGNMLPDGDYVFVIYAALPSQNGFVFGPTGDKRIWTSAAKTGFWTIARGFVGISQVIPATTVIGSSPPISGLAPFNFTYSLSRDAAVTLKIFGSSGANLVKTLVNGEVRPGSALNREIWPDGIGDSGRFLSSGTYLAQLTAADQFFPAKVTTTTASFPIDLFRITDLQTTQLLTGATDVATLSYQLSYGMNVALNIYPSGTQVLNSSGTWPPCGSLSAAVCANVVGSDGVTFSTPVFSVSGMRPGRLRITEFWDGRNLSGLFVPDGTYLFTLVAQSTTTPSYFATDRVIGTITVARGSVVFSFFQVKPTVPSLFNSSQTVTLPPFDVSYMVTRQSSVTINILTTQVPPVVTRHLVSGQLREAGVLSQDFWDARNDQGGLVQSGFYTVQVTAQDLASSLSSGSTVQQTVAVDPLRVFDVAVAPLQGNSGLAQIAYQVSETMKVAIKIYKPGTSFNAAGVPSPPEAVSLVRRIVGTRSARTQISEAWDGRDEKLSSVSDGSYVFRIVASTDAGAIDTVTGDVLPGASLADDQIVADIPVTRGQSFDPKADFENNTFAYPNPVNGPVAHLNIFTPFESDVTLRIFNLAGELVFEKVFPDQPRSTDNGPVAFDWAKVNSAGRNISPGVYFMAVREAETRGGGNVLQTVKKILIQ